MLNPMIAASLGLSAKSGASPISSTGNKLEDAFCTLQNFVDARTEGVKLKDYNGPTDRLTIVTQANADMGANPQGKWAYDFLAKNLTKKDTRDELIKLAKASRISATVVAYLVGSNGKDRRNILKECGSKPSSPSSSGKPSSTVPTGVVGMPFGATPRMTVTTTNIYSPVDAAAHLNAISGISGAPINGNRQLSFEPVGAGAGN